MNTTYIRVFLLRHNCSPEGTYISSFSASPLSLSSKQRGRKIVQRELAHWHDASVSGSGCDYIQPPLIQVQVADSESTPPASLGCRHYSRASYALSIRMQRR